MILVQFDRVKSVIETKKKQVENIKISGLHKLLTVECGWKKSSLQQLKILNRHDVKIPKNSACV